MKQQNQQEQRQYVFAKICLFFFLLVSSISIGAQKVIPFAKGVATTKEMKLSEIASKVQYISLETTPECLLTGKAHHLKVSFAGKYLFVCDGEHIYQFTPEGKYIRTIGQRGQGPGEFRNHILAVVYDEAKECILATDYLGGKVIVFSFEGKFLYDFKIRGMSRITAFQKPDLLYGTTSEYLVSENRTGCDMFILNDKGKTVKNFRFKYVEGKRYPRILFYDDVLFYTYRGEIYSKNFFENQIFRIKDKKETPVYELDMGEFSKYEKEDHDKLVLDKKKGIGGAVPTEAGKKRFIFSEFFETDRNLFIRYWQDDVSYLGVYDKQTQKVVRIHTSGMKADGFTDDIEGGMPFVPIRGNEKVMINMLPAETLLERIKPSEAKGSLKKVMTNLLEDDNPVLQVVTLK